MESLGSQSYSRGVSTLGSGGDGGLLASVRRTVGSHLSFPNADQVTDAMRGLAGETTRVRLDVIGNSRMREPLWLASIGNGPRHVLVIAGAHANEPVGSHTVLALTRYLVAEPALADGLTWHLLPVWDPDGARLNQWHAGPLLPRRYYQGFYRPVARNQPGFTFPISGAGQDDIQPLPETWAVMHVIDQARPELVVDLHNGDFGGQAWFILNRKQEGLASRLRSAAAVGGLALTDADSELVGYETDGPGVFIQPTAMPSGDVATQFAASLNQYLSRAVLSVTSEVHLWRTAVPDPPAEGPAEGLICIADELSGSARTLADILAQAAADLTVRTPFEPAAVTQFEFCRGLAARARSWPGDPTAADYANEVRTLHTLRLRAAGLLRRALAAESAAGNQTAAIRASASRLEAQFTQWLVSLDNTLHPRPIPIERLVHVQARAALTAADHLRGASS